MNMAAAQQPGERSGYLLMTNPVPEEVPAKPVRRRVKIDPANDPGGQLEQLLIANKNAHDQAEEAGEREADAKGAIKAYLLDVVSADPKGLPEAIDVTADPHGRYPGYTMTLKGGKRFDSKRFKAEAGEELYQMYEIDIQPNWELRESNPGQRRRK